MALFDLKSLNSALEELQQERGISRESVVDALATALAAAYRREYGKRGQIIRATFNPETGDMEFRQAKIVVDDTLVRKEDEESAGDDDHRSRFNPEQHIMIEDARQHRVVFAEVAGVVGEGDRHGHLAKQCTASGPRTIAAAVVHQHNLVPALDPQGRDLPDERLDRAGTVVQRDDETERGLAGSGHGVRRGMGAKRFRPFPVNGAERVRGPVSGERTQLG